MRRYQRQICLPEVGPDGQARLARAQVLIVGLGGLGSPTALYLAGAGVGLLTLVDDDQVDVTNLNRQVLYASSEAGKPKALIARDRLRALNPEIQVHALELRLSAENVQDLVRASDLVIDGTDNFETRYLLSDACVREGRPYLYGSATRFEGQASLFHPPLGPCYRCVYPESPQAGVVSDCDEEGVLGVVPGMIGMIQATEALKWLFGKGSSLQGSLLHFDALTLSFQKFEVRRNEACRSCGAEAAGIAANASVEAGRASSIAAAPLETVPKNALLVDVRSAAEFRAGHLPGAVSIPLSEFQDGAGRPEFSGAQELILYCQTGKRSRQALSMLKARGVGQVSHLEGGLNGIR